MHDAVEDHEITYTIPKLPADRLTLAHVLEHLQLIDRLMGDQRYQEKYLENGILKRKSIGENSDQFKVLTNQTVTVASLVLISPKGLVRYEYCPQLNEKGFNIVPFGKDDLGWIDSVIQGAHFKLLFGY